MKQYLGGGQHLVGLAADGDRAFARGRGLHQLIDDLKVFTQLRHMAGNIGGPSHFGHFF